MLERIKSKYILQFFFSKLEERKKLQLIKINKKLKVLLDINLIHYKLFSGRYFIGKKNGKGKEFDISNDQLIFEGDYIDGKRTGYGKEYIYDQYEEKKLIYEGKYLSGKRNQDGVEYYSSGQPSFKGKYVLGRKYCGTGYDRSGYIIYEIKDGKGEIKELDFFGDKDEEKVIFIGQYEYPNKKIGYGYYRNSRNLYFYGEYLNNLKWNGTCYEEISKNKSSAISEIKDGKGFIKELDFYGYLKYEGEYLNGKRNGKGKEYDIYDYMEFEGEFKDGKRNGQGKEYFIQTIGEAGKYPREQRKVLIFAGEYLYNSRIKGKEYYLDGKLEFEGEYFLNRKFNGKGYDEDGNIIYELINGNGKVKEYLNGDLIFEGEYLNGKRWNGKGIEYNLFGKRVFKGEYINGKRWNGYAEIVKSIKGFNSAFVFNIRYVEGIKSTKSYYKDWDH